MKWPIFNSASDTFNLIFSEKFFAHFFQRSKLNKNPAGGKKTEKKFNSSETPLGKKMRKSAFRHT